MPSLRGAGGLCPPLTVAFAPYFGLFKVLFFKHANDKTTDNDGKRNNYVKI